MIRPLLPAALLLVLAFLSGCVMSEMFERGTGFLEAKVSAGQVCPSEQDPTCKPSASAYNAWPVAVWTADRKTKAAVAYSDFKGYFKVELMPGNYIVDLERSQMVSKSNMPQNVTIEKGKTTTIQIEIDTGIN